MLLMLINCCLSERSEATERKCQWYCQNIDKIGVLNALVFKQSMNIFQDGKNCPESPFHSILCVLILGKSLHKPHWPLKWSRCRQQVDRTPDHQVWLGPYGYIYFLYVCQKTAHFYRVKQAGKVWLRCAALLEIERMRSWESYGQPKTLRLPACWLICDRKSL